MVVLTELDPPLLPPGPEPGAGGAGQDVVRTEGARGEETLRDSLGHGSGTNKTNLHLQTHPDERSDLRSESSGVVVEGTVSQLITGKTR